MTDTTTLIQRLSDEADLCRNDGATDIAKLLDDAVYEIVRQTNNSMQLNLQIEALRADAERLRALATCGCGDGFTAHDPGTCGNCMAAIDAALRQEGPKP